MEENNERTNEKCKHDKRKLKSRFFKKWDEDQTDNGPHTLCAYVCVFRFREHIAWAWAMDNVGTDTEHWLIWLSLSIYNNT